MLVTVLACAVLAALASVWIHRRAAAVAAPAATAGVAAVSVPHAVATAPITGPEVRREALVLRDGKYYQPNAAVPFTGVLTEFYPKGMRQSRSIIANGLLEGLSEGWYTNGQKQVEEHFHAGVSHGLRLKWHENGRKLAEANIVNGKLEDVFRRWHDNGVLAEEIHLRGGNPDGLARAFYPSGSLKTEARLKDGNLVDQKTWADGESPVHADAPARMPAN